MGSGERSAGAGPAVTAYERRLAWDECHRAGDFEGQGPNPTLVDATSQLVPGRALELVAAEVVQRVAPPDRAPIDALLVVRRPPAPGEWT